MPARTGRRQERGEQTRRAILEAAMDLISTRGYEGTSLSEVARRAGVPNSSVRWHFGDMDGLLGEALERSLELWQSQAPLWEPPPAGEPLAAVVTSQFEKVGNAVSRMNVFWTIGLSLAVQHRGREAVATSRYVALRRDFVTAAASWWRSLLAGTPDREGTADALARVVVALIDGLLIRRRLEDAQDGSRLLTWFAEDVVAWMGRGDAAGQNGAEEASTSRSRILAAAKELMAEQGVAATTVAAISERAGIDVSSLYWHFGDKEQLVAEVIRQTYQSWTYGSQRWSDAHDEAVPAALDRVVRDGLSGLDGVPSFIRIGMELMLDSPDLPNKALDAFRAVREQEATLIMAALAQRTTAEQFARFARDTATLVIAFGDGLAISPLFDESQDRAREIELFSAVLAQSWL